MFRKSGVFRTVNGAASRGNISGENTIKTPKKSTPEQITTEQITSEHNIPENNTPETHAQFTNLTVYQFINPSTIDINVSLLPTFGDE